VPSPYFIVNLSNASFSSPTFTGKSLLTFLSIKKRLFGVDINGHDL
jgi:hypothetical protein